VRVDHDDAVLVLNGDVLFLLVAVGGSPAPSGVAKAPARQEDRDGVDGRVDRRRLPGAPDGLAVTATHQIEGGELGALRAEHVEVAAIRSLTRRTAARSPRTMSSIRIETRTWRGTWLTLSRRMSVVVSFGTGVRAPRSVASS
jgi:hypothetical protein